MKLPFSIILAVTRAITPTIAIKTTAVKLQQLSYLQNYSYHRLLHLWHCEVCVQGVWDENKKQRQIRWRSRNDGRRDKWKQIVKIKTLQHEKWQRLGVAKAHYFFFFSSKLKTADRKKKAAKLRKALARGINWERKLRRTKNYFIKKCNAVLKRSTYIQICLFVSLYSRTKASVVKHKRQ